MQLPATSATTNRDSSPFTNSATTPATSHNQDERINAPSYLPTKQPVLTQDFHGDTFFNPTWMSGPHVFSFAQDGTVVRPQRYEAEPCPGYHADRGRRFESANASHFQGHSGRDPKPWKNVAITEQDDAEFEVMRECVWGRANCEWRPYGLAPPSKPKAEEPELVYTWPPRPHGW